MAYHLYHVTYIYADVVIILSKLLLSRGRGFLYNWFKFLITIYIYIYLLVINVKQKKDIKIQQIELLN